MPYIDSSPKEFQPKFEEDNLVDVFGTLLTNNGWIKARSFYKVAVDPRAYHDSGGLVNYSVAKHIVYRNADGALFGTASVATFTINGGAIPNGAPILEQYTVRRINDETTTTDSNYQNPLAFKDWAKEMYVKNLSVSKLYFYMIEKLPNSALAPEGSVVSIVGMPGMSGTAFDEVSDSYLGDKEGVPIRVDTNVDVKTDGKFSMSASRRFLQRAVLDVEVFETFFNGTDPAIITKSDPRCMQSPILEITLRAEFLSFVQDPIWHTNWWTDSEVHVKGYVDSRTIFLVLQADTVPMWEGNAVPTLPLYFGRVIGVDGVTDQGYALFGGTIPGRTQVSGSEGWTVLSGAAYPSSTTFFVKDASKLPEAPALLTIGSEIILMKEKNGNVLEVERGAQGSPIPNMEYSEGTTVASAYLNTENLTPAQQISVFDFDDPRSKAAVAILPLLKMYPGHPSNGVDSVMMGRSRFGARYQEHFLSWNNPSNQLPPSRATSDVKKYTRAYESMENTTNYKYQFNASRYSGKIHSSRIFVVHPEEGVVGYLDKSIAFDPQSIRNSTLRVRKQDCPTPMYEMYKYCDIGAVSPLTKRPSTAYRPAGLGIYSEDFDPNATPIDLNNDATPAGEATITSAKSTETQILDISWTAPSDIDFVSITIYVENVVYAKGITGATSYRISGLTTGFTPKITIKTVDLAGNESVGVDAPTVTIA